MTAIVNKVLKPWHAYRGMLAHIDQYHFFQGLTFVDGSIMNLDAYDGILFDLDDTLMDHTGAYIKGLDSWCEELGLPTGQYERWAEIEHKWVSRYERGDLSHPQQRRERA